MKTQTIRTTVSLPHYVVNDLKRASLKGKSFGEQITIWYKQANDLPLQEISADEDLAFFKKIGEMGEKVDLVKAIREARDERTKQLSKFI